MAGGEGLWHTRFSLSPDAPRTHSDAPTQTDSQISRAPKSNQVRFPPTPSPIPAIARYHFLPTVFACTAASVGGTRVSTCVLDIWKYPLHLQQRLRPLSPVSVYHAKKPLSEVHLTRVSQELERPLQRFVALPVKTTRPTLHPRPRLAVTVLHQRSCRLVLCGKAEKLVLRPSLRHHRSVPQGSARSCDRDRHGSRDLQE